MINKNNGAYIFAFFLLCFPLLFFGQTKKYNELDINYKSITFYPLQVFSIGEYRIAYENQITPNKFNLLGIGLIYSNTWLFNVSSSDKFYGIKLFLGKKKNLKNDNYMSFILFSKYVTDKKLDINNTDYDRWNLYGTSHTSYIINTRNKYVLGIKFLLGKQSSANHKIQESIYCGLGLRIIYYDYSNTDKTLINRKIFNFLIIPSIHFGYTLGFNIEKKYEL